MKMWCVVNACIKRGLKMLRNAETRVRKRGKMEFLMMKKCWRFVERKSLRSSSDASAHSRGLSWFCWMNEINLTLTTDVDLCRQFFCVWFKVFFLFFFSLRKHFFHFFFGLNINVFHFATVFFFFFFFVFRKLIVTLNCYLNFSWIQ